MSKSLLFNYLTTIRKVNKYKKKKQTSKLLLKLPATLLNTSFPIKAETVGKAIAPQKTRVSFISLTVEVS